MYVVANKPRKKKEAIIQKVKLDQQQLRYSKKYQSDLLQLIEHQKLKDGNAIW